jgi:5-methylthioadenosine/S-adenosylhomocysteine deaminase
MLGCIEMLRTGTTTVGDDCFFVPEPTPEIIDAVCQAYVDSGIRASVALDEPELSEIEKLPFLGSLAPPGLADSLSRRPALDRHALLDLYRHLIDTWHGADNGRLRAAVSCSAPQRVSPEYFHALDSLSRDNDLPFLRICSRPDYSGCWEMRNSVVDPWFSTPTIWDCSVIACWSSMLSGSTMMTST